MLPAMQRRALLYAAAAPVVAMTLVGASAPLRAAAFATALPSRPARRALESVSVAFGAEREAPDRVEAVRERAPRPVVVSPKPPADPAPQVAARPSWSGLIQRVDALVAPAAGLGAVAIAIRGPRGERYAYQESRPMAMASLYKLLVLAAVHEAVARRKTLLWGQWISLTSADLVEGSRFRADVPHMVDELVDGMIARSDNGAAIALVRRVGGADRLNAIARELGMTDTTMVDGHGVADRLAGYNYTTARDLATYFERLLAGSFIDPATSAAMLRRLEKNQVRDRLPARLPPGARVADKTGDLDGIRNDAGVVYAPMGPFVAVALTFGFADASAATRLIGDLGLAIWEYGAS